MSRVAGSKVILGRGDDGGVGSKLVINVKGVQKDGIEGNHN